jgi:hypothetical protein
MPDDGEGAQRADIHRSFAKELFNHVWDLMERTDRSARDDAQMLHEAHASRYHWGEVGTEVQIGRGEWQISRANALLKQGAAALFHAQLYLESCGSAGMADWDLPFAHEALARAYAALGNRDQFTYHHQLAAELGGQIADEHDQSWLEECLVTEPWWGMNTDSQQPTFQAAYPIGATDITRLPVKTLGPALAFYTNVLAFDVKEQSERRATIQRGDAEIGLEVNDLDPEQASCYFAVTNIDAVYAELNAAKLQPSSIAVQTHDDVQYRVFFAQEPYGVCFCFGEPLVSEDSANGTEL